MEIEKLIRPHLIGLQPYASARSEYTGDGILLDANENSLGCVADGNFNRYPDPLQKSLKSKILALWNKDLTIYNIFLGNGSDEIIDLLVKAFCDPGRDEIMVFPPGFSMYEKCAQINNASIKKVNLTKEFQLDIPSIRESITERTKIIFVCSPNNPTGNLIKTEEIKILLDDYEGLLVIDEAYIDFAGGISWVDFVDKYPNLIVLRTFSKSWGMASVRLGVAIANSEIINVLNTIKMPYNINACTIKLTMDALEKEDKMLTMVAKLNEAKEQIGQQISWLDCVDKVFPSDTNFLLIKFKDADAIYEYLKANHIIVRNRSNLPHCENCLRITIGTAEENKKLLEVLKVYE